MNPGERWARVESLFQDALSQAPPDRASYLARVSADPSVRAEVGTLLAAHERRGVLDQLVDEVMSPLLPARASLSDPTVSLPAHSRYRLVERLGGGGMGVVYRASDERLGREVALKFLPPHLSADPTAKKRFLVEARAAAAIEHPNICTVHEIGETPDGTLHIVMACYDGEALAQHIARGPLPVAEALRITSEISRGLIKAHHRGIVHRDIKPANVMITADGLVKILDFGIAKLSDVTATQATGAIGTLAYMSPEQAFGESVDHRTDLWSLGVVLYEMLAGVRPFRGRADQALLAATLSADPAPFSEVRTDVPPDVEAIVHTLLAKRPGDRYADAAALLDALLACAAGISVPYASRTPLNGERSTADTMRDTAITRSGERRQVTLVACTIDGHDALIDRLSPDQADAVFAQIRDAATTAAHAHGGVLNQSSSDGLLMLFGVPAAHDEDALLGVRAAIALQAGVRELAASLTARLPIALRVRMGVHVGPVVVQHAGASDRRYRLSGAPVEIPSRLAAAADPDTIVISAEARRLVTPYVRTAEARSPARSADGRSISAFVVLGETDVRSRLDSATLETLTPFVGRDHERSELMLRLDGAVRGSGGFTAIVGEAGVGKSRLLRELRGGAVEREMRVLIGRCDTYASSTPFSPFIEAVCESLGMPDGGTPSERHEAMVVSARAIDRSLDEFLPLLLALLSIPSAAYPVPEHVRGDLFQGAMLEAIAALFTLSACDKPTLLLLEDWHWSDEASRAALRQLAEVVANAPLMLVATSRPDATIEWGNAEQLRMLHLTPLTDSATAAIARGVLGATSIAPELAQQLHERTGGNPFFLEEVCEALREVGAVTVRDGEASAAQNGTELLVPETVQAVLRTRIDRLDSQALDALRIASVIGRDFTRGVLEAVSTARETLPQALERLKASGLVQQISVVPEPLFRFKHALTQEVAYDSLLEHQRASMHRAVGHAIEARYATRLDEHADRLAHHFGRAESWVEAVRYGVQAADRTIGLNQNADALNTLERVEGWLAQLPDDDTRRDLEADVLLRQERLSETLGMRNRQLELVERLIGLLAPFGPSERLAQAYLRQGDAFTLLRRFEAAERALETALHISSERADSVGERNALRSIALLRSHEGRHADALSIVERVLELGRQAADTRAEAGDMATMANILRAMGDVPRALTVLEAALLRTAATDNPVRYGALLNVIGTVHRDLGDYDLALEYFNRIMREGLEHRHPVVASFTLPAIAHIQLQQGHIEESLATYRQALDINQKARFAEGSAHASHSLAEVLVSLARYSEALPHLHRAAELFAQLEDHVNTALMWRRISLAHERLEAFDEARSSWERTREIHNAAGNRAGEAEALEGLARCERRLGVEPAQVIARYEDALTLARRVGDGRRELTVRNALGIVHWQRGDYRDAVRHYELALRLCREGADRVHEALILNSLGASLHKLRRWDEARTALVEAVRVTEQTGELLLRAHAFATLGDVAIASGRLDEARERFSQSLQLRVQLADRRGEGWMYQRLAHANMLLDHPDEVNDAADAAMRIAHELDDPALLSALSPTSL